MPFPNSRITGFTLKILAIAGMTSNHLAHVFGPDIPWQATFCLYVFGGMTYPIMAFLLVEGYRHTSNLRKYASRLLLFACAAQIPFTLCFGWGEYPIPTMNVLFTLAISLFIIWAMDHLPKWQSFLILVAGMVASFFCDWALIGPVLAFLFFELRNKGTRGILMAMAVLYICECLPSALELAGQIRIGIDSAHSMIAGGVAQQAIIEDFFGIPIHVQSALLSSLANLGYALVGFTIAAAVLCRYNGRRGMPMKWFFYAYYPLHLLVIWAVHEAMVR